MLQKIRFLVHLDQRSRWTIAITSRPSSVNFSHFKLLLRSRLEPNLAGMFLGWSSTKLLFFVPGGYSIWLPGPIICSDRLKFQRSSSLKLMNWLNPNCKWMIIGMSFTKFLFFNADRKSKMAAIAGHWTLWENVQMPSSQKLQIWLKPKLYMNVHWMVLYKIYVFCSDMKFKMVATAGLSVTLDPMGKMFQNASSLKPLGRLEPNLTGMFLGWSSTKLLFFVPVGYSIWLPGPIICSDWLKFQRSSSLKLVIWLNPNCKGKIIGMSFTKLLSFMPIGNPRWPPSQDID